MDELEERFVTLRPDRGVFDFRNAPPFAVAYLNTYYRQPPTADETVVSEFLVADFARHPPTGRFLELGCGPTVHHALPFAPHVDEIHMADYLAENLAQVELWRNAAAGAHDWTQYAAMALRHAGIPPTPEAVATREELTRRKITRTFACDLKVETQADVRGEYDAVGCFYCAEEIGISPEEWRRVLACATDHLRPGGTFYMAALAEMRSYHVVDAAGTRIDFPCAYVTESGVREALVDLGFSLERMRLERRSIDHSDCGVTATLVVAAVLDRGPSSRA